MTEAERLKAEQIEASRAAGLPMSREFDAVESACKQQIHNSRPVLKRTGELGSKKGQATKAKRDEIRDKVFGLMLVAVLALVMLACGAGFAIAFTRGL